MHKGYANQNFNFLFILKIINEQLIFPKQNQHEQNLKQNNWWGD
jgi:hypothetical protein